MRLTASLGNDAGVLGVFDDASIRSIIDDTDYHSMSALDIIPLQPGKYEIDMYVDDTYKGERELHVIVEVADGSRGLVLGDPCYAFGNDGWTEVLDATNTLEDVIYDEVDGYTDITDTPVPMALVSTGGDGYWDIVLYIDPYKGE